LSAWQAVQRLRGNSGSLGRAAAFNLAVLAVQLVVRAASLLLLALTIGPHGQGRVVLAQLVATVGAAVLSLGLEVGLAAAAATPTGRPKAQGTALTHALAVGGLCAGCAVLAWQLDSAGGEFVAGSAALAGVLLVRLLAACALGEDRRPRYAVLMIAPYAIFLGALLGLEAVGRLTANAALSAFAASHLGFAAATAVVVGATAGVRLLRRPWTAPAYGLALRAYPGYVAQLGNYRLDQLFVAALFPRAELAFYNLAVTAAEVSALPAQATANVMLPRASAGEEFRRRRVFIAAGASAALVFLAVPVFMGIIEVVLPEYERSLIPFLLLLPGAASMALGKVLSAYVTGRGRPWSASRAALATLAVTACLDIALVPFYGIVGAAIAWSLANAFFAYLLTREAVRLTTRDDGDSRSNAAVATGFREVGG
jgi:O-antigen/teichoic acid export membrane protein